MADSLGKKIMHEETISFGLKMLVIHYAAKRQMKDCHSKYLHVQTLHVQPFLLNFKKKNCSLQLSTKSQTKKKTTMKTVKQERQPNRTFSKMAGRIFK